MTEVDTKRVYVTSAEKAARETDFYRLEAEGVDKAELPPLLFETLLSEVESWGKCVIDELIKEPTRLDPELTAKFAWFLAFQFTRGGSHRSEQRRLSHELFKLRYCDLTDEGVRRELLRRGVTPTDDMVLESRRLLESIRDDSITVEPQDAALVGQAAETAAVVGEQFLTRAWLLCRTTGVMVTCDEPVTLVGGPGSKRGERAGLGTAGIILFPLSPRYLLALMHDELAMAQGITKHRQGFVLHQELDHVETIELCREVVMNAHRWAFERPTKRVACKFSVPQRPNSAALEDCGPFGEADSEGTLVRFYRPNRWSNAPLAAPWPVARWWECS